MGQKVHPYGFRVGITRPWVSRWYARKKDFGNYLVEDQKIKKFIKSRLKQAGLSKIEIERTGSARVGDERAARDEDQALHDRRAAG